MNYIIRHIPILLVCLLAISCSTDDKSFNVTSKEVVSKMEQFFELAKTKSHQYDLALRNAEFIETTNHNYNIVELVCDSIRTDNNNNKVLIESKNEIDSLITIIKSIEVSNKKTKQKEDLITAYSQLMIYAQPLTEQKWSMNSFFEDMPNKEKQISDIISDYKNRY